MTLPIGPDRVWLPVLTAEPWHEDALCAQTDPDAFFPEKGGTSTPAKAVCAACTVSADCLDWALAHGERFGIWGGLSEAATPQGRRPAQQPRPAGAGMTTTKDLDLPQRITVLKHLAGGKSVDITATITDLTPEAVLDLASHHGYPDTSKLAWAVDVLTKKHADAQRAAVPAANPSVGRRVPTPSPTPTQPAALSKSVLATVATDDGIDQLLAVAQAYPGKRIQNAAARITAAAEHLRDLIREDDERNAARRKVEAAKAEARREVERLEEQLAAAKAKLRGKGVATGSTSRKGRPLPKGHHPCAHAGCDRVFDTPQGRSLHERTKCEHRPTDTAQVAS